MHSTNKPAASTKKTTKKSFRLPERYAASEETNKLAIDKLASSGLTPEDAQHLGIDWVEPIHHLWAWRDQNVPALRLFYFGIDGTPVKFAHFGYSNYFYRLRALRKPYTLPGEEDAPKYLQISGSGVYAYFPRIMKWSEIVEDTTQRILITEGELKSAKACKEGFATIGLGGVDSFSSKAAGIDFLPELLAINWEDREVVIVFDSDFDKEDRSGIEEARQRLANQLIVNGAKVSYVDLPFIQTGLKVGLDDFLVHKSAAALETLISNATPMELAWKSFWQRGATGIPVTNLYNVDIALTYAPELKDLFRFDEMASRAVLTAPIPGAPASRLPRPVEDPDFIAVQHWLQAEGLARIGKESVADGIEKRARDNSYHPVWDWLEGLQWDGKPRLDTWLAKYLGAKESPTYLAAVGTMFLISLVARIYVPGCQVDHGLVFEDSHQGGGKSSVARELAGDAYFSDGLPDLAGDEVRVNEHLQGLWIAELPELAAVRRVDNEKFKAFWTRREDRFIPKYHRKEVHRLRQNGFIATTNEERYIRDPTGARRIWPMRCGVIDIEGLRRVRAQLFAEAVHLFKSNVNWWPTPEFAAEHIKPVQDLRFVGVQVEEPIAEFLEEFALPQWVKSDGVHAPLSSSQIAESALGLGKSITPAQWADINTAMKRLGWERVKDTGGRDRWVPSVALLTKLGAENIGLKRRQRGPKVVDLFVAKKADAAAKRAKKF